MTDIPINKQLNCQRMIEFNSFQTDYWHNDELCWLIKYLKDNHFPKDKIYSIWKEFRKIDKPEFDDKMLEDNFDSFYNSAMRVSISKTYPQIIIYQEEIDYINSLAAPLWIRQFVYLMMLHIKVTGDEIYDFLPFVDYYKFLSIKNNHSTILKRQLSKTLKKFGILKDIEIVEEYDELPVCDEKGLQIGVENNVTIINKRLQIRLLVGTCNNVFVKYENILDAILNIGIINSNYKCPVCGNQYEYTERMQRNICEECYRKQRQKRKNFARDQKRRKTPLSVF